MKSDKVETATWPVSKLKPHPRQSLMFRDLSDAELDDLADDIRTNGLRHAVEITPAGVIIAGHQRTRAAKLKLKWKTIAVVIRHDLAARGEAAVEEHLIGDNLRRRQLDGLELARCYVRLKEIERRRPPGGLSGGEHCDLRDRVAARLGRSGRALDRWLQVLRLPLPLQQAVSGGQLSQRQATRVAALPPETQQEIADAVAAGTPVAEVLTGFLPPASARHRRAADALAAFARGLARGLGDLGNRVDEVRGMPEASAATLGRARDLIDRLLALPTYRPRVG